MGREGGLPKAFAWTHPRFRTPWVGIATGLAITALLGVHLDPARTVAISPLVAGRALKGPTAEMMRTLRGEASAKRVAEEYQALARLFILDTLDAERAPEIEALGYRVLVTDTVMEGPDGARRLAAATLEFARPAI